MNNRRNFHFKRFISHQTGWAVLCAGFAFLFILLQKAFDDPELLNIFIWSWWIYVAIAAALALLTNGGFRLLNINIEFKDSYWINAKVVNERIEDNISDKDLIKLFRILKKEPSTTFKKEAGFSFGVVSASLLTMLLMGASSWDIFLSIIFGGMIAIFILGFFSLFVEEQTYAPVLRDARAKLKDRGIEINEKGAFSLKHRFNFFILLLFLFLITILSFAEELDAILGFIILLGFVAVLVANEMLAFSVYSVFREVSEFAGKFPKDNSTRIFSGSYFKEAVDISDNFNKSAYELKKFDKITKEEKNKIKNIIDSFTYPIIFIEKNGYLEMFNEASQKILGFKKNDIGTKISPENEYDIENFKKIIRIKNYQIKEPRKTEGYNKEWKELNIKENGTEKVYMVATRKVYDENDQFLGTLKIFNDLTREENMNRLKSEFISVAAHQLRTPLSAIKWVFRMVLDKDTGELSTSQEEYLAKGYKSAERVITLVDNLLYASRIEEGRFGYDFEIFDPKKVVDEALDNIRKKAEEKKLDLDVKKSKNIPKIEGDPEKIKMALYYVLDNAVKYTQEKGNIELEVKNINKRKEVAFKIKDSGVGIPSEGKNRLFSKFYRAANVLRMQTEGNGLGLFIIKSIIEKHEGSVEIDSEEGKGTEVTLVMPVRQSGETKKG
ncbi:MAG: ATP-binding protein [Patescibacteria group bacterium]